MHNQIEGRGVANATRKIGLRLALVAMFANLFLLCGMVRWVGSQPPTKNRPALFLGNESLPPINFMKDGKPTGVVVDLVKAVAQHMHRPVEIRLMNWSEAQQSVLDGRADGLMQINPNPERLELYDFSEPLLTY